MGKNRRPVSHRTEKLKKKFTSKNSDFGVAFWPVMVFNRPFMQSIAECKFPKISEFFLTQKHRKNKNFALLTKQHERLARSGDSLFTKPKIISWNGFYLLHKNIKKWFLSFVCVSSCAHLHMRAFTDQWASTEHPLTNGRRANACQSKRRIFSSHRREEAPAHWVIVIQSEMRIYFFD